MDEGDDHAALAHSGRHALDRAEPDVTAGEDPRHAGLQQIGVAVHRPAAGGAHVGAGEDVAARVQRDLRREPGGLGVGADEDEQAARLLGASPVSRSRRSTASSDALAVTPATSAPNRARMFDRVASWSIR